jgi:hypothetical protein
MTRLVGFDIAWSEPPRERYELALLENCQTAVVYFLQKHYLPVRIARRNYAETIVELALGS